MRADLLTDEEKRAIASLSRLAKKWPKSLVLVHSTSGGGLRVVLATDADKADDLGVVESFGKIDLPVDSCS